MNREALIELKAKVEAGEADRDAFFVCFDRISTELAFNAYQGSFDAAKSLHEAVLQGWGWSIYDRSNVRVYDYGNSPKRDWFFCAYCRDNPARAWLLAILSALIAMEPEEPKEGY